MKKNHLLTLTAMAVMSSAGLVFGTTAYDSLILSDGAYAYWPLQETTGPTIYDIAGTNNGTLMTSTDPGGSTVGGGNAGRDNHESFANASAGATDGATYLLGGAGILPGVPGDTAIYFTNYQAITNATYGTNATGNVENSMILVPYNAPLDSQAFTAETWLKLPTYPIGYTNWASQTALGFEANGGNQTGWTIAVNTDSSGVAGELQFNLAHSSQHGSTTTSLTNRDGGAPWLHAVMVYDKTNLYMYRNGVLAKTVGTPTYANVTSLPNHLEPLVIGAYCQSYFGGSSATGNNRAEFYYGGISHVAVYHAALTAGQILNHYNTGVYGPNCAPVIATQPAGITNYVGYSPSLSVSATGNNLVYHWFKNTLPLAGQTNATLALNNLVLSNAGTYYASISNVCGATNSATAVVGVLPLPSDPYQASVISMLPRAYYPLHETGIATNRVTVAVDLIGEGNNGTYATQDTNTPTPPLLGQPGPSPYLGTAVTLTNTATNGIYIDDPNAMAITGNLTLEAWVQVDDGTDLQNIIAHGPYIDGNPSKAADILGIDPIGEYYINSQQQTSLTTTNYDGVVYPVPPGDVGTWVYLVGLYDGANWRLYRNGVDVADNTSTNGAIPANGGWAIGARNLMGVPNSVRDPSLSGSINNVAIYDYALSPVQIWQHYQIGTTGATTVPAIISIQQSGGNVIISWTSGVLLQANAATGPWTTNSAAVSPITNTLSGAAQFYQAVTTIP